MSIEYRGDGKYRFRIRKDGIPYRKKFFCPKKLTEKDIEEKNWPKEVNVAHNKFELNVLEGKVGSAENMKFEELAKIVKEDYIDEELSISTQQTYESIYNVHLLPQFGERIASQIKKHEVQKFINLKEKEHPPKTVHAIYCVMCLTYSKPIEWKMLSDNPCSDLKLPEIPKTNYDELLSEDEIARLLLAYEREPSTMHKLFFYIAMGCGLRHGEILGLKIEDIDFKKNIISVTKQMGKVKDKKGKVIRGEAPTKTKRSVRKVYAPDFVIAAALAHIKQMNPIPFSRHLFWDYERDAVMTQNYMLKYFRAILADNGIKEITVHNLRHLKAVIMLHSGAKVVTVARTLGDTIETIIKNYTHTIEVAEAKAAVDFENYLTDIQANKAK